MVSGKLPSPAKIRSASPTAAPSFRNDGEESLVPQYRSISVADSDTTDIGNRNESEANASDTDDELVRSARPEEEQPMSKERRLVLKQLERFRLATKKKTGRLHRNSLRWNAKTQASSDEIEFDSVFGSSSTYGRELRVVSYPWPIWTFGVLIVMAAVVFAHRVRSLSEDANLQHADWWKYLVAAVVLLLGFGLIANGRVETFYMNKDQNRLVIRSSKPLCLPSRHLQRERLVERELHEITSIRVEASGEFSGDIDTRTYKVHFDFDDGTHASALEARSKKKTMRRCRLIKAFASSYVPQIAPSRSATAQLDAVTKIAAASPQRQVSVSHIKLRGPE
ncbi:hypothetical protein BBJ28_00010957 [Nothophytophthora sp. Chile5]|nr:hypothetical protein BBJ28_00010957 [Nothophytophthora sp. Chile5]